MKKHSLIKGTFILGIAGVCAKFLGLFFRWPLIMLIGDEGVGYYQMAYPLYLFFIAVSSGIPVAISKMVSEKNAIGDNEGIIQVFRKSLILMIFIGGGFTAIILKLSKFIVRIFNWDYKSYYSLLGISIAPVFISIMSTFRGFFQGMQNMTPTAVSQIIEQLGRVIIGIGLVIVLLPKGIEFAAGGASLGATAGAVLGNIYLYSKYKSVKSELNVKIVKDDLDILSKLIYISIPISLGATVSSIMSLIDSALVPGKLVQGGLSYKEAAILYGQLTGKAFVLINVPLTVSMALCTSIVPIIAEYYILNRRNDLVHKVNQAIKFSTVISIPSFIGLFFLSKPIMSLLFIGNYEGFKILKYLSISIPFIALCQTFTSILQGIGIYVIPVINLLIGCVAKFFITRSLVPIENINVYGAVIGTILGYSISTILNIICVKRMLKVKIEYKKVILKPLLASFIMIFGVIISYNIIYKITLKNSISCLISILFGIIIYSILVMMLNIFEYRHVKNKIYRYKRREKV